MKRFFSLAAGLGLALMVNLGLAQQGDISAEINRTELQRGETVTLQIRVNGQQSGVQIDLEPLREKFEIVSTRSASQLRSVNNRIESWTDYILVLFPRQIGEQEVPSLTVGSRRTPSFAITVTEPEDTGLSADKDVFLETVLNKTTAYVQEQLLFTVRLYYTIAGIRNPNFTEIEPPNTVVQMLGPPQQYERLVDGVRYGVYEKNYVIFPQNSGELVIPDIVFRGELTDGSSNFVFRNRNMQPVTAFAEGYRIEVKERPASFPAGRTWLPAQDIQIRESWNRDITRLNPGDSVERTITIVATGLDGAALPPLTTPEIEHMNVYPEPAVIQRMIVDGNVVGTRIEKSVLVATEDGSVVIPEINLPWWDVDTNTLQTAVIPASYIQVGSAGMTADEEAAEGGLSLVRNQGDSLISSARTPAWILNLMALVIALVLGAMWWMWRRRQALVMANSATAVVRAPGYERDIADGQEKHAFAELESHLPKASAQQIRTHLIAWGRQFFSDAGLYNLDDLAARLDNRDITGLCLKLQASLYAADGQHGFDDAARKRLLALLKAERSSRSREQKSTKQAERFELPPLYKH